jgi:S-DNA-T family DNA segregation ATPase FtsK/SpoIIIE
VVLTGLSNHGKTFALRALLLWSAFDPCVEFRLADFKGIGDWSMFEGLATELIEGPSDRHVIAGTHMIEATVEEMEDRLERARSMGFKDGVPEEVARKPGSGFHPIVVAVDEAQKAVMCPAIGSDKIPYGGLTNKSRFLTGCREIQNQGRAVNVVLYLGTQDPTPQNFPVLLRNSAHLRASLPLGSKGQSEMVLGEDAVAAGAAPHRLRRGIDKGVVVAFGEGLDFPVGQSHMTVWTHFVSGEDAHVVADRAKDRRKAVATRTGRADGQDDEPELDVLADVAAVVGDETRLLKQEVMLRLAERDDRYREFTDARLKAELEAAGAAQYTYNGVTHIHGDRVRDALARRFSATD